MEFHTQLSVNICISIKVALLLPWLREDFYCVCRNLNGQHSSKSKENHKICFVYFIPVKQSFE